MDNEQVEKPTNVVDVKSTEDSHKKRHEELHKMFDELVADWIMHTRCLPSRNTVMELMEWSNKQQQKPDHTI